MPIAGLVVTLCDDDALSSCALEQLARDARVTVGPRGRARKVPLVSDTATLDEQQDVWRSVANTPGILLVDLVYEDFSDVDSFTSDELPKRFARGASTAERFDGTT